MKYIIKKIKRRHLKQIFIYGIVGVAALLLQMVTYLLLSRLGLNPVIANLIGACGGIIVAYKGHVKFTFEKEHRFSRPEFVKYVFTAVFGIVFNSVGVYVLINILKYHADVGIIPMLLTPGVTFIINKFWSFK